MTRAPGRYLQRITAVHLLTLVVLLALLWVAMGSSLPTLDFWWHLKTGEVLWTARSIPRVDAFSFTAWGQPFILQSWLAEVIYHLTYLLGGFPLLIFLHAMTIVLSFGVVLWLAWEITDSLRPAALCVLVGEVLAIRFTNARPQVFSMLLFALFYLMLQRYCHRRSLHVWGLIPLMVLWVNTHGAFVLGMGLVSLITGTEVFKALFAAPGALSRRQLVHLGLVLLLLVLASLVNPEGWRVYEYVREVQTDPASQKLVMEWQSPSLRNRGDIPFFITIFLGFLTFTYSTKRDLTNLILFSCFAAFGLASLRGIIWFAIILPPILAVQLGELDVGPIRRMVDRWQSHSGSKPVAVARPMLNSILIILLVGITLLLSPWVRPDLVPSRRQFELVDSRIPREAMEFIAREGIEGRIFHPQEVGDYLIWRLYPQQHSFIDGRVHLYSEEFARDYLRILNACGWETLLAKYDIEWVLLLQDEGEGLLRQDLGNAQNWRRIYEDDQAILYSRAISDEGY